MKKIVKNFYLIGLAFLVACSPKTDDGKDMSKDVKIEQENKDTAKQKDSNEATSIVDEDLDTEGFEEIDLDYDYVVIGAGPSGLSSAIQAAEAGLSVGVFEKTSSTGGAAKFGMGPLALESHIQKDQDDQLSVDEAFDEFTEYTHWRIDAPLVYDYFKLSGDTIAWLENMGVEFEGTAKYFEKSYETWHIVKSDKGVKGGGQAETMTRKMTEYAKDLGVDFHLETPAYAISKDGDKVSGIMAVNTDEEKLYKVKADATLVATGGFGNNIAMLEEELGYNWGEDYFGMRFPGHEGDGLKMAWDAGANKSDRNIEMIFNIYSKGGPQITPEIMVMMRQPGLLVNTDGQRFFNEEQIQNTTYTGNALVQQTGNTGYMLLTKSILDHYLENGVDFPSAVYQAKDLSAIYDQIDTMVEEGSESVFHAKNIKEAADFIGCSESALKETVDKYNEIVKDGKDPLGKSDKYLREFKDEDIYIAQYYPGSYGTLGGIDINRKLEVLDENAMPIEGLYSAGTDSCHIFGDSYMFLMPGNTMGYSLNSGRLSANSVIEYIKDKENK